jgi:PAS domain S-box-containing protein
LVLLGPDGLVTVATESAHFLLPEGLSPDVLARVRAEPQGTAQQASNGSPRTVRWLRARDGRIEVWIQAVRSPASLGQIAFELDLAGRITQADAARDIPIVPGTPLADSLNEKSRAGLGRLLAQAALHGIGFAQVALLSDPDRSYDLRLAYRKDDSGAAIGLAGVLSERMEARAERNEPTPAELAWLQSDAIAMVVSAEGLIVAGTRRAEATFGSLQGKRIDEILARPGARLVPTGNDEFTLTCEVGGPDSTQFAVRRRSEPQLGGWIFEIESVPGPVRQNVRGTPSEPGWTYDPVGDSVLLDPGWESLLGADVPTSLGTFLDAVHPLERGALRAAMGLGTTTRCTYRVRTSGGSWRRVVADLRPHGAQLRAEHVWLPPYSEEESPGEAQDLIRNSPDFIIRFSMEGRVLHCNDAAGQLLGNLPESLSDLHPTWAYRRLTEESLPKAIESGSWVGDSALLTADGSEIACSQAIVVHRTPQGWLNGFTQVCRDITPLRKLEFELRTKRLELADAQRLAGIGRWEYDSREGRLILSDEAHRVFGVQLGSRPRLSDLTTWIHPDDVPRVQRTFRTAVKTGSVVDLQFRAVLPDTTVRVVSATGQLIRNSRGRVTHASGFIQDVTRQQLVSDVVRANEERLRQILESLDIGFWMSDSRFSRLVYASPVMRSIWGRDEDELLGPVELLLQTIHPDDYELVRRSRKPESTPSDVQFRIVTPQGGIKWVRNRSWPVHNSQGEVVRFVGAVEDITRQVNASEEVQTLEQMLDDAQHMARIGSWDIDLATQRIAWTPVTFELFERDPALGNPTVDEYIEQIVPEHRELVREVWTGVLETGKGAEYEIDRRAKDGSVRTLRIVGEAVRGPDGAIAHVHGTCQDVTAQKEAERALVNAREAAIEASEAKSRFLATVSHDIRTPLAAISGLVDQLGSESLTEHGTRTIHLLRTTSNDLLKILNDILDLSRLEAGKMIVQDKPFDALVLAEEVARLFAPRAAEKGVFLLVAPTEPGRYVLTTDPLRLRQILNNLVSNAVRATDSGCVQILLEPMSDGKRLRIRVVDTGSGVPDADQGDVFQRISPFQGNGEGMGTGLGLSIVKELVSLLGGQCGARNRQEGGAEFWVELPAQIAREPVMDRGSVRIVRSANFAVADSLVSLLGCTAAEEWNNTGDEVSLALMPEDHESRPRVVVLANGRGENWVGLGGCVSPVSLKDAVSLLIPKATDGSESVSTVVGSVDVVVWAAGEAGEELVHGLRARGIRAEGAGSLESVLSREPSLVFVGEPFEEQAPQLSVPFVVVGDGLSQHGPRIGWLLADRVTPIVLHDEWRSLGVIDWTYLNAVSDGDRGFEDQLVQAFLTSAKSSLERLDTSIGESDFESATHAAHTLKGSSRSVGVLRIAKLAEATEAAAKGGQFDLVARGLTLLRDQFAELIDAVRARP